MHDLQRGRSIDDTSVLPLVLFHAVRMYKSMCVLCTFTYKYCACGATALDSGCMLYACTTDSMGK